MIVASLNKKTAKKFIPYGRPCLDASDIHAVVKVLKSPWLTQGAEIERFEEAFARYCDVPFAVAVSSGTAALHLANLALGVKETDEVITSPLTFAATANSVLYCGGTPRFADIEPSSLGLDKEKVRRALGNKTKGIIPVHFGGQPCDLFSKNDFSSRDDFFVLEDACHALGAEEKVNGAWRKIGSCHSSDAAAFSFHAVKHMTTGEGGMVTTRRKDVYEKLKILRTHGIEKNNERFLDRGQVSNPWYYEMQALGFNYRLTDIQCALGTSQLKRLDDFVEKRRGVAAFYDKQFKNTKFVKTPAQIEGRRHSYHLYVLRIDFKSLKISRAQVIRYLAQNGVGTQVHYVPVVQQPYYKKRYGSNIDNFPACKSYYDEALSIPIFPAMSMRDAAKVTGLIKGLCLRKKR